MPTLDQRRHRAVAGVMAAAVACGGIGASRAADHPVYRCGQTYQQVPCAPTPGASAMPLDARDERSADQRADAKAQVTSDKQRAKAMAAERRERERSQRPQQAPMGLGARAVEAPSPTRGASAPATGDSNRNKHKKKKKADEPERYVAPPQPPGN